MCYILVTVNKATLFFKTGWQVSLEILAWPLYKTPGFPPREENNLRKLMQKSLVKNLVACTKTKQYKAYLN